MKRLKKCENGCGRLAHGHRIGECSGGNHSVLKQLHSLWFHTLGGGSREIHFRAISLMLKFDPTVIVHVVHGGDPICDRSRQYEFGTLVWPENEIWVGIFSEDERGYVNCHGCLKAMPEVLTRYSLQKGFDNISDTLKGLR